MEQTTPHPDDAANEPAASAVLAENLQKLSDAYAKRTGGRKSINAWTAAHGIDPKIMQRLTGPRGVTTATLAQVASALGLEAWQLLVPGVDPDALPRLAGTTNEAAPPAAAPQFSPYAQDLARELDAIRDPWRQ